MGGGGGGKAAASSNPELSPDNPLLDESSAADRKTKEMWKMLDFNVYFFFCPHHIPQ